MWTTYFGGERDDYAEALVPCADGGYAILASTKSFYKERFANSDIWLIKTTPDTANAVPEVKGELPRAMTLLAAYPNPFNKLSAVSYQLSVPGQVRLAVFGMDGREVAVLAKGFHPAGEYRRVWDAAGMAGGAYLARLQSGGEVVSRKLVLIK